MLAAATAVGGCDRPPTETGPTVVVVCVEALRHDCPDLTDVPVLNRLAEEGKGFTYLAANLAQERLSIAVAGVSAARACLNWTLEYVGERTAFGKSIGTFQQADLDLLVQFGQAMSGRES